MIHRIVEFRTRTKDLYEAVFDVQYKHLIEQPIAIVRRIYDYSGLAWSYEFEIILKVNKTYNPADFGLTFESVERH